MQIFVVSFTLFIHICTSESQSHVTHTLAFEKELSCHLSTLEGKFHIIYSFGKHSHAISDMGTFFLKGSLCYLSINKHILKGIFAIHSHFARYFMPYIHTLCKAFSCYIYSHIYIPLKGIFHAT